MAATDRDQLRLRFTSLCTRLGLHDSAGVFDDLYQRYTAADRHYHDIHHIAASLSELDGVRHLARDPAAIELAIWFHDCIYDAHRLDNEEQSAEIARQSLQKIGASKALSDSVCELILATRHTSLPVTPDEQLLTDIDLAPLGAPAEVFETNGRLIRREYAHLDDQSYARGRAEILRNFLSRARIFATELFARRYEQQARANLSHAINGTR
jgi:predicted metal-dependent HD superfamily phosphohydrolase